VRNPPPLVESGGIEPPTS